MTPSKKSQSSGEASRTAAAPAAATKIGCWLRSMKICRTTATAWWWSMICSQTMVRMKTWWTAQYSNSTWMSIIRFIKMWCRRSRNPIALKVIEVVFLAESSKRRRDMKVWMLWRGSRVIWWLVSGVFRKMVSKVTRVVTSAPWALKIKKAKRHFWWTCRSMMSPGSPQKPPKSTVMVSLNGKITVKGS